MDETCAATVQAEQIFNVVCDEQATSNGLNELDKLRKFKEYFDELYGIGLEVKNWHLNGDTEPFDNFYESAICESGL